MTERGHLFVVLGKIGSLVADATVIPTDRPFKVEDNWHKVVGQGAFHAKSHRPARWKERGWGRSAERDDIWFLEVYDRTPAYKSFHRLAMLLKDVARQQH